MAARNSSQAVSMTPPEGTHVPDSKILFLPTGKPGYAGRKPRQNDVSRVNTCDYLIVKPAQCREI